MVGTLSNSLLNSICWDEDWFLERFPKDTDPDNEFKGAGLVPVINSPLTHAVLPAVISTAVAVAPYVSSFPILKGITVSAPSLSIIYPYCPSSDIPNLNPPKSL